MPQQNSSQFIWSLLCIQQLFEAITDQDQAILLSELYDYLKEDLPLVDNLKI